MIKICRDKRIEEEMNEEDFVFLRTDIIDKLSHLESIAYYGMLISKSVKWEEVPSLNQDDLTNAGFEICHIQ